VIAVQLVSFLVARRHYVLPRLKTSVPPPEGHVGIDTPAVRLTAALLFCSFVAARAAVQSEPSVSGPSKVAQILRGISLQQFPESLEQPGGPILKSNCELPTSDSDHRSRTSKEDSPTHWI